jgi:hypothetical protein
MRLDRPNAKPEIVGRLRRSQVVSTYGCGSIVSLPRESVVIAGTDYWSHAKAPDHHLNEHNLQALLGVTHFVTPPFGESREGSRDQSARVSLPSFRFPDWLYCPRCGRTGPAKSFGFVGHPKCRPCNDGPLIPSRFVVACEGGHLDDFPYEWWVHYGGRCEKRHPTFRMEMSGTSPGLEGITIVCSCKKDRSMSGSFSKEALTEFRCLGRRPWLDDYDPLPCKRTMRTMQRGATNLHFGVRASAISIPPWSRTIEIELNRVWLSARHLVSDPERFKSFVHGRGLPLKCSCSADDILRYARERDGRPPQEGPGSWLGLLKDEYEALCRPRPQEIGEFRSRETPVPDLFSDLVAQVVQVVRLREVIALRGFRRISPEGPPEDPERFTMLGTRPTNWLPAIELKGEGLFIRLDEQAVRRWELGVEASGRYRSIGASNRPLMQASSEIGARYFLLHTFAHILIRQLSIQCGYSSASLKERIYSQSGEQDEPMAGFLIYTAANDSEGSLGGLVREGAKDRLDGTLNRAIQEASWCSVDPLCIQSTGQGLEARNLAACHCCTLVPETSCEARNCYLDRAALVGTLDQSESGYFQPVLHLGGRAS